MAYSMANPSTFDDVTTTNTVLQRHETELKTDLPNYINAIMGSGAGGHAHTGSGTDGSQIDATTGITNVVADKKLFGNAGGTAPEWAIGYKIGSFTRDTSLVSGTQAVTGVGFKPSNLIFLVCTGAAGEFTVGFDNGTTVLGLHSINNVTANAWTISNTYSIKLVQSSPNQYEGKISSLDADGFTVSWTKSGSKTGTASIAYMAFR